MITRQEERARQPQPWGRPALRSNAKPLMRGPAPRPVLTPGTLTWAGDRVGTVRLDSGASVDARLPDVLWLRRGDRVMLYRYPDGWVAVLRVEIGRPLDFTEGPGRRTR